MQNDDQSMIAWQVHM